MGRMFGPEGRAARDRMVAEFKARGMWSDTPPDGAQTDDTPGPVDLLVSDLADAGIGCVVYTGGRIAVTDATRHEYTDALATARALATLRGLPVTVLDSPL